MKTATFPKGSETTRWGRSNFKRSLTSLNVPFPMKMAASGLRERSSSSKYLAQCLAAFLLSSLDSPYIGHFTMSTK